MRTNDHAASLAHVVSQTIIKRASGGRRPPNVNSGEGCVRVIVECAVVKPLNEQIVLGGAILEPGQHIRILDQRRKHASVKAVYTCVDRGVHE